MNLRTLSRLVVDTNRQELRYEWPDRTVVRPIEHPHKIDDVIALAEYAGADVEHVKERTMGNQKLSSQNGTEALLEAVRRGKADMINGNSLVALLNQGLIDTEADGKTYYVVADRVEREPESTPTQNGNGHKANGYAPIPEPLWSEDETTDECDALRGALRDVREQALIGLTARKVDALADIVRIASRALEG